VIADRQAEASPPEERGGRPEAPGRAPITAIVTTRNEERNIEACLRSLDWAAEVLVVDSFSGDATRALALPLADRVLQHPYESPARQKNWAVTQARHAWILILDADERVTPDLAAEIRALAAAGPPRPAYWIRRQNTYLGRTLRYGGWGSDEVIRFFHRDRARYPDVRVHEEMEPDGEPGRLAGRLLHHSVRSLAAYGPKMETYSTWWAEDRAAAGRRASAWSVFSHTTGRFVRMYILQAGFLEGGLGLIVALQGAYSVFLKYAKLWEKDHRAEDPD
jgi:glycosyltransferase involved in cell wall biosynthesis